MSDLDRHVHHFVALALLGVTACGETAEPGAFSVRDSVGVDIAESTQRLWSSTEGWTVATSPTVDLATSGVGSAHEFFRVNDALRTGGGSIAVAMPDEIRFFDWDGKHLGSVGGAGEGPGEFAFIGRIELLEPDSLAAFDPRLRRISVFDGANALARTVGFDIDFPRHNRFAVLDRDFVVVRAWPSVREEGDWGLVRVPVPVLALHPDGSVRGTLTLAAGSESVRLQRPDGMVDIAALFGRDSHIAGRGEQLILGDAEALEYRVFSSEGELLQIVRASYDVSLSEEDLDAERAALLGDDPSARVRQLVSELPVPDRRPAYMDLKVDATGAVWLKEHRGGARDRAGGSPQAWEVFDAGGVWLGTVRLPPRFTVFEIGHDYVLGVLRDNLDVEHVQVLGLSRG